MRWLDSAWPQVLDLTVSHLVIALPAIALSVVLAVPLGFLAHRRRRLHGPLLALLGILYAIPSLPLLIMIPAAIGTGLRSPVNMVLALTLYGIAILVRQVSDAFDAVPSDTLESADAAGFGPWRRFWQVELPLAAPVIASGARVVVVSTISLVTVGAVIGVHSLGTLFTDGFQRGLPAEVLTGLVGTLVLALILDGLTVLLTRLVTPWTHPGGSAPAIGDLPPGSAPEEAVA